MTTISDDFNRADNTSLGATSVGGATWIQGVSASWQIVSNQAKLVATNGQDPAIATFDAGSGAADGTLAVTMGDATTSAGLVFRVVSGTNLLYAIKDRLLKLQSGGFSTVGTYSSALASGDILTVILAGSSITVQKNSSTVLSTTSTFQQSITRHGIGAEVASAILDNFSLTYTAPPPPRRPTICSRAITRAVS